MKTPPIPDDEPARLDALRRYEVLDTGAEQAFDNLTALAARICEAPIALISLVDENRQWFKSAVGLAVSETSRDISFCGHALLESDLLIIPDALADPRFADNPLVTSEPYIRFYAGAVLKESQGVALGTLCVIDHVPRELGVEQQQALRILAEHVVIALRLRRETSELARTNIERERLAAELRDSEAQFRDLAEGSVQGIVIDRDGEPLYANQTYADIFGYQDAEAILHMQSLDPTYTAEALERVKQFRIARAEGRTAQTHYDFQGVRRDGRRIWVETRIRNITWQGRPAVQSTLVDITERKRSEEALRLRSAAVEAATDGILIADVRAGDSPRLVYASPAFLSATGYSETEVLGRDCHILQSPNTDPDAMERFCEAVQEARSFRGEVLTPRKSGEDFWNLLRVEPLHDANGDLTHFVCVQTDITERKKIEQALAHSVQELEIFAYSVAHDFKAPLRAMRGFSQALADEYSEILDETARGYLDHIVTGARRMGTLIDDLLEYSQVGWGEVAFERIDLRVLLSQVKSNLAADIDSAGATVRVQDSLPVIEGHATTLAQVFQNLVANAIKFGVPDTTPDVAITCQTDTDGCVIAVRDNGVGIDQTYQDKIFDIFQRLHTTADYPGTGIGLAIVKKGVTLHHGAVWIDSAPGKGSAFFVRLPRSQP